MRQQSIFKYFYATYEIFGGWESLYCRKLYFCGDMFYNSFIFLILHNLKVAIPYCFRCLNLKE